MSEEEIDVLYNEILKLPKIERPITATTMCELNVNDLFDTIREFRKIPEYSDLLNENKRLKQQLQQKENIIKEVREYIVKNKQKIILAYGDNFDDDFDIALDEEDIDNMLEILDKEVN